MTDPIREVVGDEAKAVLLQFMGQELPTLHKIDRHITNRTPSLQGITLNMHDVINKISTAGSKPNSSSYSDQAINNQPGLQLPVNTNTIVGVPTAEPLLDEAPKIDPNQLFFNFKYDAVKDIADKLNNINDRLEKIEQGIDKLTFRKNKKKIDDTPA